MSISHDIITSYFGNKISTHTPVSGEEPKKLDSGKISTDFTRLCLPPSLFLGFLAVVLQYHYHFALAAFITALSALLKVPFGLGSCSHYLLILSSYSHWVIYMV